jgi:putative ABC transport system permease protein
MWLSRLLNHFRSDRVSDDIAREMDFHLAERADDLVGRGMSPDAARHEARRRFGNVGAQRERARERNLFAWLDSVVGDVRYALRSLRAAPAFAFVAILSLALGIGANTAIFSLINAVMLKELPVAHPEELVSMRRYTMDALTNPLWEGIRDRQDMFSTIAASSETSFNLSGGGETNRVRGIWVSGDFYKTLGVHTILGREISHGDDYRGCPAVAVLSYGFWRDAYAASPNAIGKTIVFDGHPFTIIGVNEPGFTGVNVGMRPQVYVPICDEPIVRGANSALDRRTTWWLRIVGRPKAGLTVEQINARLKTFMPPIIEATIPATGNADGTRYYRSATFTVQPAARGFSALRGTYSKALYVLLGITVLVLLVACANVANLLLARAAAREREMAVRVALGAGRGRLARQLITESLILATLGATLGIVFAMWGSRALIAMLSRGRTPVALDLSVDPAMLVFTIAVTTATGLLFGLVPAWRASRVDPQVAMKANARGVTDGRTRFHLGKSLVALQVAMSLVLIAAAGLLVGSWRALDTLDPGFRRDGIVLVDADVRRAEVPKAQRDAYWDQLIERIRVVSGVASVSLSDLTPISGSNWNEMVKSDDYTPATNEETPWVNAVSAGYFTTMGIPLLAGRDFNTGDSPNSPKVALVSESMARHFFKGAAAVGKHFQIMEKDWSAPIEVIGIVANAKYNSLRDSMPPVIYFSHAQQATGSNFVSIEVRVAGNPLTVTTGIKDAIASMDRRIALDITTLDRQLEQSMAVMRTVATLSAFFGGVALLLATVGLYGIMTYTVARRRTEIGVRIALGAERSRVVRMVLGETARIIALGVIVGIALSFVATRLIESFLYGLAPRNPAVFAASAGVLAVSGLIAAALPASRAARLDPVAALRDE